MISLPCQLADSRVLVVGQRAHKMDLCRFNWPESITSSRPVCTINLNFWPLHSAVGWILRVRQ